MKNILKSTTRLDSYTGQITAPGHPCWGMGKAYAFNAVVLDPNTVTIEELAANNWLIVYPNPVTDMCRLLLPENGIVITATIISPDGRRIVVSSIIICSIAPTWRMGMLH